MVELNLLIVVVTLSPSDDSVSYGLTTSFDLLPAIMYVSMYLGWVLRYRTDNVAVIGVAIPRAGARILAGG